ncbi:hypothetical protein [Cellulophaga baltica]|uniref:hypothetical protein n=1 Tax=Cellulophaga baltica TaxID=76594 RepID=UPI002494B184|nr:hypothetical protein [Cellulophaga baltica]
MKLKVLALTLVIGYFTTMCSSTDTIDQPIEIPNTNEKDSIETPGEPSSETPLETSFYTNGEKLDIGNGKKTLVLTGEENENDSNTLNAEIDRMSSSDSEKGGEITLTKVPGKPYIYLSNIVLKNNIHIKIASDVIIRPWFSPTRQKNVPIFEMGMETKINNVAITCVNEDSKDPNDYFNVELTGGAEERVTMLFAQRVTNFKVSGIKFFDSNTIFSNLEFNLDKDQSRKEGDISNNGVVKNMVSLNNHVGYGLIQARAAKHVLFKNLDGQGGVTLRLETGFLPAINSKDMTLDQIVGRDIIIRDGDAAVMLSPHRVTQGHVDISGIEAYNATYAAQIDGGFIDDKGGVDNLGTFNTTSSIRNFKKIEGGTNAQVKLKDYPLYPCPDQEKFDNTAHNIDDESKKGASLTVVRYGASPLSGCVTIFGNKPTGCYEIELDLPSDDKVNGTVLGLDKKVVYPAADKINCN